MIRPRPPTRSRRSREDASPPPYDDASDDYDAFKSHSSRSQSPPSRATPARIWSLGHRNSLPASPQQVALLSDTNNELQERIDQLNEQIAEEASVSRQHVKRLEKQISTLRSELAYTQMRNGELEEVVSKDDAMEEELARNRRNLRAERLKEIRENRHSRHLETIPNFAPAPEPLSGASQSPTRHPRAPSLGVFPHDEESPFALDSVTDHESRSHSPPINSPETSQSLLAEMNRKVLELERVNNQLIEQKKQTGAQVQKLMQTLALEEESRASDSPTPTDIAFPTASEDVKPPSPSPSPSTPSPFQNRPELPRTGRRIGNKPMLAGKYKGKHRRIGIMPMLFVSRPSRSIPVTDSEVALSDRDQNNQYDQPSPTPSSRLQVPNAASPRRSRTLMSELGEEIDAWESDEERERPDTPTQGDWSVGGGSGLTRDSWAVSPHRQLFGDTLRPGDGNSVATRRERALSRLRRRVSISSAAPSDLDLRPYVDSDHEESPRVVSSHRPPPTQSALYDPTVLAAKLQQTSLNTFLQIWIYLQLFLVVVVFIYAAARRGPSVISESRSALRRR